MNEEILASLSNAQTKSEWNEICDQVRENNGGEYPDDWFSKVILSGLAGKVSARF